MNTEQPTLQQPQIVIVTDDDLHREIAEHLSGMFAWLSCMEADGVPAQELDEEIGRYEYEHRHMW